MTNHWMRFLASLAVITCFQGAMFAANINIGNDQNTTTGDVTNNYTFLNDGLGGRLMVETNARIDGDITLDRNATLRILSDASGYQCQAEILWGDMNTLSLNGNTLTVEYAPNNAYVPSLTLTEGTIAGSGSITSSEGSLMFMNNFNNSSASDANISARGINISCDESFLPTGTFEVSDHVIFCDEFDYTKDINININTTGITFFANPSGAGAHPYQIRYTGEFNFLNDGSTADFGRTVGFTAPQMLPNGQTTMTYYIGPDTFNKVDAICVMGGIEGDNNPFVYGTLKIDNLDDLKNDDGDWVQLGFAGGKLDMTDVGTNIDFTQGEGIGIMTFYVPQYPGNSTFVLADNAQLKLKAENLWLDNGLLNVEGNNLTVIVDCGGDDIEPERFGGFKLPSDATLQFINTSGDSVNTGNLEGSGTVEAAGKTLALGSDFANDDKEEFTGTIDGAAGFEKVGTGTSVIGEGATAAIAGNATVSEGLLVVNSAGFTLDGGAGTLTIGEDAELGGTIMTGDVLVGSGGVLGPGMSIGYHNTIGNVTFSSGAELEIEVEPLAAGVTLATPGKNHDNDLEHVTGDVTFLSGSSIVLTKDADSTSTDEAKVGDKYKVLVAEGDINGQANIHVGIDDSLGSFSANYEIVNESGTYYDSAGLEQTLLGNWLIIELRPGFQPETPNQTAVNQYLQNASGVAASNIRTQLNGLSQAQQGQAINELSGQPIGTVASCVIQNSSSAMNTLADNIRPGMGAGAGVGSAVAWRQKQTMMTILAQNDGCCDVGCCTNGWTSWTRGYGLGGSIFADENTASTVVAVGGLVVGLEKQVSMNTKGGLFYTYGGANSEVASLSSAVQTNSHLWGAYMVHERCNDYFVLGGGMGADFYDSRRVNQIGAIQELALDKYSGWEGLVYSEVGRSLDTRFVTLQPYFGLQYIYMRVNSHEEDQSLAPNTANYYSAMNYDSLRTKLGMRVKRQLCYSWFNGDVEFRSTWVHELLKKTAPIYGAGLVDAGGGFIAQGADIGRDRCVLGVGMRWDMNHRTKWFVDYDLDFNARQTLHTGSGGLAFQF